MRHRFRHGVGESARADIVNEFDGIVGAQRAAPVNDFLGTALHLRVAALHRGKIERLTAGAAPHRRGRAAAQTNEHRRTTQHHQQRTYRDHALLDVHAPHIAKAARQHDGLVVAANAILRVTGLVLLEGTEIPTNIGTAEFVIEGRSADRSFEHDIERRSNPLRGPARVLPGLLVTRNAQVRDREAHQPGFGLGTQSGRALVANLTARTRGSTRKRRNGRGVIVRLYLDDHIDRLIMCRINTAMRIREITGADGTCEYCRVVAIG